MGEMRKRCLRSKEVMAGIRRRMDQRWYRLVGTARVTESTGNAGERVEERRRVIKESITGEEMVKIS